MAQYSDWSGPSVQGGACSYATLGKYNGGTGGMALPDSSASARSQRVILPSFSPPPGYTSVSGPINQTPSCTGYPSADKAYGGAHGCAADYVAKLCQ